MNILRPTVSLQRSVPLLFAALFLCCIADIHAAANVDPRLKEFAKLKRQQMENLAAKLHLDVPTELRDFFNAAEAGDCAAVSNAYARIQQITGQVASNTSMPGWANVLDVPVRETRGAYEFCD